MPTKNTVKHQNNIVVPIRNTMFLAFLMTFGLLLMSESSNAGPMVGENSLQRAITFTEPTQPLQFRDNVKKKPRKKNLKKSRLLRKMGNDFKNEWMSIEEPVNVDIPTVSLCNVAHLITFIICIQICFLFFAKEEYSCLLKKLIVIKNHVSDVAFQFTILLLTHLK